MRVCEPNDRRVNSLPNLQLRSSQLRRKVCEDLQSRWPTRVTDLEQSADCNRYVCLGLATQFSVTTSVTMSLLNVTITEWSSIQSRVKLLFALACCLSSPLLVLSRTTSLFRSTVTISCRIQLKTSFNTLLSASNI